MLVEMKSLLTEVVTTRDKSPALTELYRPQPCDGHTHQYESIGLGSGKVKSEFPAYSLTVYKQWSWLNEIS